MMKHDLGQPIALLGLEPLALHLRRRIVGRRTCTKHCRTSRHLGRAEAARCGGIKVVVISVSLPGPPGGFRTRSISTALRCSSSSRPTSRASPGATSPAATPASSAALAATASLVLEKPGRSTGSLGRSRKAAEAAELQGHRIARQRHLDRTPGQGLGLALEQVLHCRCRCCRAGTGGLAGFAPARASPALESRP